MIADDIRLSQAMAEAVARHAELLATQELSITTFHYVPRDLRTQAGAPSVERHLDALNRELLDRLQRGGEAFVSNAIVGGRYLLRACVVNFHTERADVEAVPEIVARIGRKVDAEPRPPVPERPWGGERLIPKQGQFPVAVWQERPYDLPVRLAVAFTTGGSL